MAVKNTGRKYSKEYEIQIIVCDNCHKDMTNDAGRYITEALFIEYTVHEDLHESGTFCSTKCAKGWLDSFNETA